MILFSLKMIFFYRYELYAELPWSLKQGPKLFGMQLFSNWKTMRSKLLVHVIIGQD